MILRNVDILYTIGNLRDIDILYTTNDFKKRRYLIYNE